ncbi:MAG TPA: DUF3034 family protein [Nevskiaceae bacterium]|nr:DUF3034 family protein [Nevskiaceae bacterium]
MKGIRGRTLRNLLGATALLTSGGAHASGLLNDGKVFLTGGVVTVDGAGGGGITPWATITGYETRDGINGGLHYTFVYLPDYSLNSYGAAVGFYDRFELSYTHSTLPTGSTFDTVGLLADTLGIETGIEPFNTTIGLNVYGAKLRLIGDAVYTSDSLIPQIAVGGFYKKNDSKELLRTLQADKSKDWEAYICATKVYLAYSTLLNVTARYTSANQTGLTGFGGPDGNDKEVRWEGSVAFLLTKNTAIGGEFQQHGDNLDGVGVDLNGLDTGGLLGTVVDAVGLDRLNQTLTQYEDDWYDLFFAYAPNKNLSFTMAYAMLGNITLTPDQHGFYFSLHATF